MRIICYLRALSQPFVYLHYCWNCLLYTRSINDGFGWGNMLKNLTFWAEIDEIDGFLVIFYSSKMLVQGLTTNGHHKSFFCYLFYVAIYMRYLKSVVRPLVLFFWEVCVSGLQCTPKVYSSIKCAKVGFFGWKFPEIPCSSPALRRQSGYI